MKRFFAELFWFVVICIILMVLTSFCLSVLAPGANQHELGRRLSGPILIASLIVTIVGAKFGILPGTKKK